MPQDTLDGDALVRVTHEALLDEIVRCGLKREASQSVLGVRDGVQLRDHAGDAREGLAVDHLVEDASQRPDAEARPTLSSPPSALGCPLRIASGDM